MFFFNDTATTEIYTLSLHDALPISVRPLLHGVRRRGGGDGHRRRERRRARRRRRRHAVSFRRTWARVRRDHDRSEEHTSELQSRQYLVCRLLLEKTKTIHSLPHYAR